MNGQSLAAAGTLQQSCPLASVPTFGSDPGLAKDNIYPLVAQVLLLVFMYLYSCIAGHGSWQLENRERERCFQTQVSKIVELLFLS